MTKKELTEDIKDLLHRCVEGFSEGTHAWLDLPNGYFIALEPISSSYHGEDDCIAVNVTDKLDHDGYTFGDIILDSYFYPDGNIEEWVEIYVEYLERELFSKNIQF